MMHVFLSNNRDELIARCKEKAGQRPNRAASDSQLKNGVPIFLSQLQRTLQAEEVDDVDASLQISGPSSGNATAATEMGVSAAAHGKQLLELGFTVAQVVHAYGDLCQAITDLAFERDAPFGIDEFRTLNRCLDNAIAEAVTEFNFQRDASLGRRSADERIGFLAHELRNSLSAAMLAAAAMELGSLSLSGATGAVLKRSLESMKALIHDAVGDVRAQIATPQEVLHVESLVAEAAHAASLYAQASGCQLIVAPVESGLQVFASREGLLGVLANLLENAFKFTRHQTEVTLSTHATVDFVKFEVTDHCGGLPPGYADALF